MSSKQAVVWLFVCFTEFIAVYVVIASSSSNNVVDINNSEHHDELSGTASQSSVTSNVTGVVTEQSRELCDSVPHDVLWQRLQISSAVPDDGQWIDDDDDQSSSLVETTQNYTDVNEEHPRRATNSTAVPDSTLPENVDMIQSDRHARNVRKYKGRSGRRGHRRHQRHQRLAGHRRHVRPDSNSPASTASEPNEFKRSSWHCRLEKRWKRMPPGVFPTYIQTGTCRRQSTCMHGLYECRPRRYRIKVLRRVEQTGNNTSRCSPLANVGTFTRYEQTWHLVERKVVVGCECSRKRVTGSYYPAENG